MRRAELALNTIIVAVIALLVLVVVIIIFTKGGLNFLKGATACENAEGTCKSSCDGADRRYPFGDSECKKGGDGRNLCCVPESAVLDETP